MNSGMTANAKPTEDMTTNTIDAFCFRDTIILYL